ncbi:MAG: efflux RND transporter periplasmic adaptor subunit, partial [Pseudomonadota bacterium]
KAGTVLVRFIATEERADLSEAQATLREALTQYDRIEGLVARGNASKSSLDAQKRLVEEARSRAAAAEARVADRIIRAPFNGILGLRAVSPGSLVSPGDTMTTLDDISEIRLDFDVPERFLAALEEGQEVAARTAAYPGEIFTGRVAIISTRVDPVTRSFRIRSLIDNTDGRLRPGMFMTVILVSQRRMGVAVPEEALIPVGSEQFLFVIDDEMKARRRKVKIGFRLPGRVEILEGVELGERVVTRGGLRLRPDAPVRVLNDEPQPAQARSRAGL